MGKRLDAEKAKIEAEAEGKALGEDITSDGALEVKDTAKVTVKGKSVAILDKTGNIVRTYSEKDHGKGYLDLAKGFAKKNEHKGFKIEK